jgi:alginate O-acetyltransferase complex protein AlgI
MIVMGLGGLWHGAGLNYLAWGLLHGFLLVIERPFLSVLQSIDSVPLRALRAAVVFLCVTMLWIFFKLPDFDHALGYLAGMFATGTNPNPPKLFYNLALLYSLPVILQHLRLGSLFERGLRRWEPYAYGALGASAYLEAGPETAFIYFQF